MSLTIVKGVAVVPLKATAVAAAKLVPLIVTGWPTKALVGLKLVTVGALADETRVACT